MTEDELKALYEEGKKILKDEREKRRYVFAKQPDKLKVKVAEMNRVLQILAQFKDELKKHIDPAPEQGVLLDIPKRNEYR